MNTRDVNTTSKVFNQEFDSSWFETGSRIPVFNVYCGIDRQSYDIILYIYPLYSIIPISLFQRVFHYVQHFKILKRNQ